MGKKAKIVVFSGAGMSAESGLKTFRDNGGLWESYNVEEVATPSAWKRDPKLVLEFYNMRRSQLLKAKPNKAHKIIAKWEKNYDVQIITQNIDDLHERAGSTKVLHLHGELLKARSLVDSNLTYEWKKEIKLGDKCEKGSQLRPHVVWFGESVPLMDKADALVNEADIFITIGTSLNVYPAAGLVGCISPNTKCFLVDPKLPKYSFSKDWTLIQTTAADGLKIIEKELKKEKEAN